MRSPGVPVFVAVLLLCGPAGLARANIRAPFEAAETPSASLRPPGADQEVKEETLRFECEDPQRDLYKDPRQTRCQVSATYVIKDDSTAPHTVMLEFILPVSAPPRWHQADPSAAAQVPEVTAAVNQDSPAQARSEWVPDVERAAFRPRRAPSPPGSADLPVSGDEKRPLLLSRFPATLRPGENRVNVRYKQLLSYQEHGYGYFHKGYFTQELQYELWPLKEWRRAAGFSLHITVTLPREPPSRWSRFFHTQLDIRCGDSPYPAAADPQLTAQQGDRLIYDVTMRGDFPDQFFCIMGKSKQL